PSAFAFPSRPLGLYDLASDPQEKKDLLDDKPRAEPVIARYKAFRRSLKEVVVRPTPCQRAYRARAERGERAGLAGARRLSRVAGRRLHRLHRANRQMPDRLLRNACTSP